ncbi:MAG: RIP metalloprotease RseP [Bryobacterales bacterium]|nr:RIP metalloprotease RseP [Bryobacterales bacterium]
MAVFESVFWVLVLIGIMIMVHELGHFWAARYFKVKVEAFSFGLGPRLFGFRWGDTDYRISAIPFGGFVKMAGEQMGGEEGEPDPDGFMGKPRWQRLIIAAAGPAMNIILAVGLLTGLYMVKYEKIAEPEVRGLIGHVVKDSAAEAAGVREGDRIVAIDGVENPSWEDILLKEIAGAFQPLRVSIERTGERFDVHVTPTLHERSGVGWAGWAQKNPIEVGRVSEGMPAEAAGLRRGDLLVSVDGHEIHARSKLVEVIKASEGRPVEVVYERDGERHSTTIQPVYNKVDGESYWMIGIQPDIRFQLETLQLSLPDAFTQAVEQNRKGATLIFQFLRGMVERRMSAKQLQGPIGIAKLSSDAAKEGPSEFIHLMSMVSLNLAIFNLLPIPILDGGVILLLLVEMAMRRDLSIPVKEAVIKVGFVFLMAVMVFALYNDISRILPTG